MKVKCPACGFIYQLHVGSHADIIGLIPSYEEKIENCPGTIDINNPENWFDCWKKHSVVKS